MRAAYSSGTVKSVPAETNLEEPHSEADISSVGHLETSNLSPANVHPTRETSLQYSPFPVAQSMPTKYGNSISSIGGQAISMSEVLILNKAGKCYFFQITFDMMWKWSTSFHLLVV